MEGERGGEGWVEERWGGVAYRMSLARITDSIRCCLSQSLNYEARLADLQKRVADKLQHVMEDRDVSAASTDDVTALCRQLDACEAPETGLKVGVT